MLLTVSGGDSPCLFCQSARELCAPLSPITRTLSRTAGQAEIGWGRVAARPCDLTLSVPLDHHGMDGGRSEGDK